MHRLALVLRSSLALASLTISIVFAAFAIGLVPDHRGAVLEGRKNLCEAVAIQCSLGAQRKDVALIQETINKVAKRNPDILSAAVRTAGGELLVVVGDHATLWGDAAASHAIDTHMEVPIALGEKTWGTVEIRFRPPVPKGMFAFLGNPVYLLVGFIALAGFVIYAFYLWAIIRQAGGGLSNVIPKRVRATIDTLAEGVVILDKDQKIAMANEAFARITGKAPAELQGRSVSEFSWLQPQKEKPVENYPWSQAVDGVAQTGVLVGLRTDTARPRTFSVNSAPILGDDGTSRGVLATFDDMTAIERKNSHLKKLLQKLIKSRGDIRRQNQELKTLATRDTLTLCLNRRSFFSHFESHFSAATRYGHPLSCVMVDVDHFKSVNDTYGHSVGDQVLQHVAEILRTLVRKSDLVCRYGGEEFCILLPHVDLDEAWQAADRFREGIQSKACAGITVTASLGVSAVNLGAREPRELLDQADKSLYAAKRSGRNRVIAWDRAREMGELPADQAPRHAEPAPDVEREEVPIPFHAVTALVSALAYRHLDTAEHSRRVADLCVMCAEGLVSQSEAYVLEVAGMLHDIGKLGVPDAILLKPGPLDPQEWAVIRTHERIGEEIITAAFTSGELTAITRNHHAWYGGTAHAPDLPVGKDIPLGARILAIADAYDAMVSDRVYRRGRGREEAFVELRRCAGQQFDPELVERFITTLKVRDETRNPPEFSVTKQTALRIGTQIEGLANALDAQDIPTLAMMAGRLRATASEYGIDQIASVAAELEKSALSNRDRAELIELTIDLLDLCRSTYRSYLPSLSETNERPIKAEDNQLVSA